MDSSKPPAGEGNDRPADSKITNEFIQVAKFGSAVGFGFMAASIQALNRKSGNFTFEISFWTLLAFVAGVALALVFWRLALSSVSPRNFRRGVWLMAIFGLGAFLYPLRFIARENMREHLLGLLLAAGVLSAVGFVFLKIKGYLDKDYDSHPND